MLFFVRVSRGLLPFEQDVPTFYTSALVFRAYLDHPSILVNSQSSVAPLLVIKLLQIEGGAKNAHSQCVVTVQGFYASFQCVATMQIFNPRGGKGSDLLAPPCRALGKVRLPVTRAASMQVPLQLCSPPMAQIIWGKGKNRRGGSPPLGVLIARG